MRYLKLCSAVTAVSLPLFGLAAHAEGVPYSGYERVTDVSVIYAMIKEYASFSLLDVRDVVLGEFDGAYKVIVEVYGFDSDSEKRIRRFVTDRNLDESCVEYMWFCKSDTDGDKLLGDANSDGKKNVRDCAYIANCLSAGRGDMLPDSADYNGDGKINVRDAAALSKDLAGK